MIASGDDSPEALSGFVKFHPQYPVLKVPGGASRPPCASRSRLARRCILRTSPPRVKGKFGFGRIYYGARADSAESSEFPQLAQSLPRGPCRPSLWRSLHNRGKRGRRRELLETGGRAVVARGAPPPPRPRRRLATLNTDAHARRKSWRRRISDMPAAAIRQYPRLRLRGKAALTGIGAPTKAKAPSARAPVIPEGAGALVGRAYRLCESPFRSMRDADHDSCAARASAPSAGRLDGAGEFKRTRKGHRPAPTPPNETRFPPHGPICPIGPAPRRGRAPGRSPGDKKRGPPSPAGPSGIRGGA